MQQQCFEAIETLTRAAEYCDEETGTHVNRISYYTSKLAEHLGMDNMWCENIFYASPMYDLGKLAIPDKILLKPGKFTNEEWEIMKSRTTHGYRMINNNKSPYLQMGAEIALSHHEYWEGSGYPYGLVGEKIPLPARLMMICDVYDVLRSQRLYKSSMNHNDAVNVMRNSDKRIQVNEFDPTVYNAFLVCSDTFEDIYENCR
jgi:putative two-component system response regulator